MKQKQLLKWEEEFDRKFIKDNGKKIEPRCPNCNKPFILLGLPFYNSTDDKVEIILDGQFRFCKKCRIMFFPHQDATKKTKKNPKS